MCVSFLQRFQDAAGDKVYDVEKSEAELMKFCKTARGKDESFVSIFIMHVHMVYNNKYIYMYNYMGYVMLTMYIYIICIYIQCYYIGASETSATRIIISVTKPLSYSKPVEKICKDLGKKDAQICELKYG